MSDLMVKALLEDIDRLSVDKENYRRAVEHYRAEALAEKARADDHLAAIKRVNDLCDKTDKDWFGHRVSTSTVRQAVRGSYDG